MKIRIEDIPEDGLNISFTGDERTSIVAATGGSLPEGTVMPQNVSGDVRLLNTGKEVFFSGSLSGEVRLTCSRCLVDFTLEERIDINLVLRPGTVDKTVEEEYEETAGDVVYLEADEIDPYEIVVQEMMLSVPMKPLCREDCPGLCSRCGNLKGSAECQCPATVFVDPRWEGLARLKDKLKS